MGTSKRVKLGCDTSTSVTNSVPSVSVLLSTAPPAKCVIVEVNYSNGGLAGYKFEKSIRSILYKKRSKKMKNNFFGSI